MFPNRTQKSNDDQGTEASQFRNTLFEIRASRWIRRNCICPQRAQSGIPTVYLRYIYAAGFYNAYKLDLVTCCGYIAVSASVLLTL
jgi:hypothetical protein